MTQKSIWLDGEYGVGEIVKVAAYSTENTARGAEATPYEYTEGGSGDYDAQIDVAYVRKYHKQDGALQNLDATTLSSPRMVINAPLVTRTEQSGIPVVGDFDGTAWETITDTDTDQSYILSADGLSVIEGFDPFKTLTLPTGLTGDVYLLSTFETTVTIACASGVTINGTSDDRTITINAGEIFTISATSTADAYTITTTEATV